MKKILVSCVVLFLLNILHINQSQAQDWQNSKSTTLHTQFPTDAYAQKVKVYANDYLVGITKVAGVNHYGFVLWKNSDNIEVVSLLNTVNIIVNDFTFFQDEVYFCGKRLTNQGSYIGIIGHFNMNDFINVGNFNYEYTDVVNTENLTKIISYTNSFNENFITAIGDGSTIIGTSGQIIELNISNNNFIYQHLIPSSSSQTQLEILNDLLYYENCVITLSNIYHANSYVIRYFKYNGNYLENVESHIYTFPNTFFIFSSNPKEYPIHIADISLDLFAVSVSASDGLNNFSMINIHNKWAQNLYSSQILYHDDKEIQSLEMEYSPLIKRLLLLNNSYFNGLGKIQTITYIDPFEINTYVTLMENFNTPTQINHFSLISSEHYAVAGTYSNPQSNNNLQLFATKNINYPFLSCLDKLILNIDQISTTNGTLLSNIGQPFILNTNWVPDNTFVNIENININCID